MTPNKKRELTLALLEQGPATADMLAIYSGMSRGVASDTLAFLRDEGLIHESGRSWRTKIFGLGAAPHSVAFEEASARQHRVNARSEQLALSRSLVEKPRVKHSAATKAKIKKNPDPWLAGWTA